MELEVVVTAQSSGPVEPCTRPAVGAEQLTIVFPPAGEEMERDVHGTMTLSR